MRLTVLLPIEVLVDEVATRIVAEAQNGSFCLLPRHVDFVTALVPGVLSWTTDTGEQFAAVSEGILVKSGPDVSISARDGVRGEQLGTLRQLVEERFLVLDDRERSARRAVARLEADFFRRFLETGEPGRV
jgi:F-type H+-transporting ATPase subunit epsilon